MPVIDRLQDERLSADALAAHSLNSQVYSRWNRCRSTHRFLSFAGKRLVVYQLLFDKPQVKFKMTCRSVEVSVTEGLRSTWRTSNGEDLVVDKAPAEMADNCFIWMPKHNNTTLQVRHDGSQSLWFGMCYRTLLNPGTKVDGVTYILEQDAFDSAVW